MFTEQDILTAVKSAGLDVTSADAIKRYLKDVIPNGGIRPTSGYMYEGGPFSLIEGDIFSSVVTGGGPLARWLPSSRVTHRFERIKHLEFVAPENFDGSQSYSDWLAALTIEECGFGPSTSWSGFEYEMDGGSFRWSTDNMKVIPDGGMTYYQSQPMYTVRGIPNQQLADDREWAIARVLIAMEQHLDYVLTYGNRANSDMEWDGLEQIVRTNYVTSRKVGPGTPHWAQPVVINGATITTASALLTNIRAMVRRIRNRLRGQNKTWGLEDMILYMPQTMWDNLAEAIASGAGYSVTNSSNFAGQLNFRDYMEMYQEARANNILNVDGEPLRVVPDSRVGINTTINPGGTATPAVSGPVKLLTRRAGGDTLLEQQYVDYSQLDYPTNGHEQINSISIQDGVVKAGWVVQNNECFKYYAQMAGRVVCRGIQYQGRIDNVIIPTLVANENESPTFTSPDFYAFGPGNQGGDGTGFLNPV